MIFCQRRPQRSGVSDWGCRLFRCAAGVARSLLRTRFSGRQDFFEIFEGDA
jgi:hypothetical protein